MIDKLQNPVTYLVFALIIVFSSTQIHADQDHHTEEDHEEVLRMVDKGELVHLETILQYPGLPKQYRLLEIELEKEDGKLLYEIEVLESGKVREFYFDAKTGQFIKEE